MTQRIFMTRKPNQYVVVGEITHIILCDKWGKPIRRKL